MPESDLHGQVGRLIGSVESLHHKVDLIDKRLLGTNGANPGVMTRLDRLEQTESRRSKLAWAAIVAALGALVTTLGRWMG